MINFVRAFSLREARELFRRRATYDRTVWIGFEPAAPSPVRKIQGLYARVFEVADVEPDKLPEGMAADDPRIPNIDHARQIVSMLRMAHEKPETMLFPFWVGAAFFSAFKLFRHPCM